MKIHNVDVLKPYDRLIDHMYTIVYCILYTFPNSAIAFLDFGKKFLNILEIIDIMYIVS